MTEIYPSIENANFNYMILNHQILKTLIII